jgi:hypothetical protein
LTRACPRSLKAAESEKRVIKRRTSSSGAGGESASSGQRSITPAFAAGKVRAASVEDALGRWIYAEKVPPIAFDHRSWPAVLAALKTAPDSMPAPRRFIFPGWILDDIGDSESRKTLALINDPPIEHTSISANWDAATAHKQPTLVWVGLLPRIPKALLVDFINLAKITPLEGSKDSSVEARIFLRSAAKTCDRGRCITMLRTRTRTTINKKN